MKYERRPIPGWEGLYSADKDGNIWSDARTVKHKNGQQLSIKERMLKSKKQSHGYKRVNLWSNNKRGGFYVHRLVCAAFGKIDLNDRHQTVDHINRNRSDNRIDNLRLATQSQNSSWGSGKLASNNTSGYRGVHWFENYSRWRAEIRVNQRTRFLGYFDCPVDAARAYDAAAREHFGEFAYQNFPRKEAA